MYKLVLYSKIEFLLFNIKVKKGRAVEQQCHHSLLHSGFEFLLGFNLCAKAHTPQKWIRSLEGDSE